MAGFLYQITAPDFVAGVIVDNSIVIDAAPILKYMKGWTLKKVAYYCKDRDWEFLLA